MVKSFVTFASYSIKIKDRKDEDKKLALNKLYKKGLEDDIDDFLDILISFFNTDDLSVAKKLIGKIGDKPKRKTFVGAKEKILALESFCYNEKERTFYGRLYYGSYGKEHTATDTKDFTEIIVENRVALLQPFYFLFYLPKGNERGILLVERKGNDAIKTTLEEWFKKEVFAKDKSLSGYRLKIKGYLPKKVWEKLIKGKNITSFAFEEVRGLSNKEDYMSKEFKGYSATANVKMEVEKNISQKGKDKVKEILNLQPNEKGFIEFEQKTVKNFRFTMKINGKDKTFFLDGNSFYPYMDILVDDLDFEKGHPKFNVIHKKGVKHAKDLLPN
nr:hypothetical protein [Methanobrevibacter arboriphilus]